MVEGGWREVREIRPEAGGFHDPGSPWSTPGGHPTTAAYSDSHFIIFFFFYAAIAFNCVYSFLRTLYCGLDSRAA
jgi:hypothetical protein